MTNDEQMVADARLYLDYCREHGVRLECRGCERAQATVPCRNGAYCDWCAENNRDAHRPELDELRDNVVEAAKRWRADYRGGAEDALSSAVDVLVAREAER